MAQQTAVEYLISNLPERFKNSIMNACAEELEQAKEIEKKQIMDAFIAGGKSGFNSARGSDFKTFEDYCKETYKK